MGSGLSSSLGGLLLQGLSPGPVLGFSVNPRTVQNMTKDMAKTQNDHATKQLQCSVMLHVHAQDTTLISNMYRH